MVGRPYWTWFEYILGNQCNPKILNGGSDKNNSFNLASDIFIQSPLDPELVQHTMEYLTIMYSFWDYYQFIPRGMRGISDDIVERYPDSQDFSKRLTSQYFINVYVDDDKYRLIVIMDEFVR